MNDYVSDGLNGVKNADFGNKIAEIADHYGFDSQSHMLIEEMAELAQAINKLYRAQGKGQPTTESKTSALLHIYEELADVEICVEQIKHLLSCRGHVDAWKDKKIKRQLERIRREKNGKMICDLTGEVCPTYGIVDHSLCFAEEEMEVLCPIDKYKADDKQRNAEGIRIISTTCIHQKWIPDQLERIAKETRKGITV